MYIDTDYLSPPVPRGKRQWKAYYAYLKGFLLYFAPVSAVHIHVQCKCTLMLIAYLVECHQEKRVMGLNPTLWQPIFCFRQGVLCCLGLLPQHPIIMCTLYIHCTCTCMYTCRYWNCITNSVCVCFTTLYHTQYLCSSIYYM